MTSPSPFLQQQAAAQQPNVQAQQINPDTQFVSKLQKLRALAPSLGISQQEVESFANQQQTNFLAQKGFDIKDIQSDPVKLNAQFEQVISGKGLPQQAGNAAESYVYQLKESTNPSLTDVPAEDRGAVADLLKKEGVNLSVVGRQNQGKVVAENIKNIRDLYLSKDLAKGRIGGTAARLAAQAGFAPDVKNYMDYKASAVLGLKDLLMGSGGRGASPEILGRVEKLLPSETDTPEEVAGNWENLRGLIKTKFDIDIGDYQPKQNQQEIAAGVTNTTTPQGKQVGRFVIEEL